MRISRSCRRRRSRRRSSFSTSRSTISPGLQLMGARTTNGARQSSSFRRTSVLTGSKQSRLSEAVSGKFGVSQAGTLAAEYVTPAGGESLVVVSMYALWEGPLASAKSSWFVADGSTPIRIVWDLSAFIVSQISHRIIASGDLNILYGYGENGSQYWKKRYQTVFDRMDAIGLPYGRAPGVQRPASMSLASDELPQESKTSP